MQVAFRADASLQIGTGHVMRCLTLADALRERGASCTFVCRPHPGHLLAFIAQRGHQALSLPELQECAQPNHNGTAHGHWLGTDWTTDAQDTQQALSAHTGGQPVDWLVVDHYELDARWEEALRPQAQSIMAIDDLADRPHACDLLLDQNLGRTEADYGGLLKGNATTLVGPQYALLRPEFAALRSKSLARRQAKPQLQRLLVTMGGVDKDNATGQVLAALHSCCLPSDLRVTVVMGPHAPWLAQVQTQASKMPWPTEVLVGVDNMAQLMANSDMAIGAAGTTSWERCCMGLPSFLLVLAENQLMVAYELEKTGAAKCVNLGGGVKGISNEFSRLQMQNRKALLTMSINALEITSGLGAIKVAEKMFI